MSRSGNFTQCQLGGKFFPCKEEARGVCQYCGRNFCLKHGDFLEENQEVCHRKNCVAKRDDLAAHLIYRDAVLARNREQHCGLENCSRPLSSQCTRCTGYFCSTHIFRREDSVLENQVRITRMASLCQHCIDRRPIWTRK